MTTAERTSIDSLEILGQVKARPPLKPKGSEGVFIITLFPPNIGRC